MNVMCWYALTLSHNSCIVLLPFMMQHVVSFYIHDFLPIYLFHASISSSNTFRKEQHSSPNRQMYNKKKQIFSITRFLVIVNLCVNSPFFKHIKWKKKFEGKKCNNLLLKKSNLIIILFLFRLFFEPEITKNFLLIFLENRQTRN